MPSSSVLDKLIIVKPKTIINIDYFNEIIKDVF